MIDSVLRARFSLVARFPRINCENVAREDKYRYLLFRQTRATFRWRQIRFNHVGGAKNTTIKSNKYRRPYSQFGSVKYMRTTSVTQTPKNVQIRRLSNNTTKIDLIKVRVCMLSYLISQQNEYVRDDATYLVHSVIQTEQIFRLENLYKMYQKRGTITPLTRELHIENANGREETVVTISSIIISWRTKMPKNRTASDATIYSTLGIENVAV